MIITGLFNEDIPNAGPTTVFVGHAFDLISRRRRSEHEAFREAFSAQPAGVQMNGLGPRCFIEVRCTEQEEEEG